MICIEMGQTEWVSNWNLVRVSSNVNFLYHFTWKNCTFCAPYLNNARAVLVRIHVNRKIHIAYWCSLQERLAAAHGSQCGFCTPGFVMSMYTLLRNHPVPTDKQLENAFDGTFVFQMFKFHYLVDHRERKFIQSNVFISDKKNHNGIWKVIIHLINKTLRSMQVYINN